MRELSTPSLFAAAAAPPLVVEPESEPASSSEKLARDFIRWCCSFGSAFRNSPDVTNLRYWAKKTKVRIKESEETGVLIEARKQYQKRLAQSMTPSN